MSTLVDSAVEYATKGWRVFPLKEGNKEPHNRDGFKSALTDVDFISKWWNEHPRDNVGIATDDQELFVLDIDGPDGDATLERLEEEFGRLPETLMAQTGKGKHFYFRYSGPESLGISAGKEGKRLGKGIDTRGTGGYVVAPPSIHPDGRTYRWVNWGTPLAWLPDWVVNKLKKVEEVSWQPKVAVNTAPQVRRVWERACLELAKCSSGSRNEQLNHAAFTMGGWIASGQISRDEVERGLWIIAHDIGLEEGEIAKTMESGIESGMQQPIYPTELTAQPYEGTQQHRARVATGKVNIRKGSTFDRSKVGFFWNNRIPLGKLTILAGPGGVGKSFLTLELAAHVTAGHVLMDTRGQTLDGEMLFCSYEDDVEDTIGPRADRLGVDLDRCHFITGVDTEHGQRDFGPQDVAMITEYLRQCPDIKLIVVDPLGSFMGGASDMNAENQTRAVLQTLTQTAQKTGTAIVVVAHLRKAVSDDDPIHRISGSVGITNISRSVLMVDRDKEDPRLRWVKHVKHNYSKPSPDISYTFEDDRFQFQAVKFTDTDNAEFVRITLAMNSNRMPIETIYERGKMHGRSMDDIAAGYKWLSDKNMVEAVATSGNRGYEWVLKPS